MSEVEFQLDLSIIDKAIALLEAGPLVVQGQLYQTEHHYSCYALRMAQGLTPYYMDDRTDPYLKAYIAFSAEKFGLEVCSYDCFTLFVLDEGALERRPKWWNADEPYVAERVAHLKEFREWLVEQGAS